MKKVFTLLSPTLLKSTSLLLCLFFLFSQSVFSLEKTPTDSTKIEADLKSDPPTKDKESKQVEETSIVKNDEESDKVKLKESPVSEKLINNKLEPKDSEEKFSIAFKEKPDSNILQEEDAENDILVDLEEDLSIQNNTSITEPTPLPEFAASPTEDQSNDITNTNSTPVIKSQKILQEAIELTVQNKKKAPLADSPITEKTILITEIQLDTSISSHEEYIELYNTTNSDIDLENYKLNKHTASKECTDSASTLISSSYFSGIIKAHDYFVITHKDFNASPWHNLTFSGKSYTIAKNSTVTLRDDANNVIDRVGFGTAKCFEKHTAENPAKNESIERKKEDGKYIDTDNNVNDFKINPCPFPGNYLPTNLSSTIRINEIYPNPCSKNDTACTLAKEFIELYNPDKVSLEGWKLTDSSTIAGNIDAVNISESPFIKLTKDTFKFTLNNTGDIISLIAPDCSTISQIKYLDSQRGLSLNYGKSWYNANPTPGIKNALDPRTMAYPTLLLNEMLPNPSGAENTDEFIEIYNPNDTKINLKNWMLKDSSKTGSYTFSTDNYIEPRSFFTIYRKDFSFALNNSDETVSLIAPNEKIMSFVAYESSKEDVSYNYDSISKKWRHSKHLTPNKENIFNNLPTIKKFEIDDKSYKNVYTDFVAKATDRDGEELKVRWDFGDGRKSYLWKTRHKYTKTGTYYGNLRIQDESEEVLKKFTVTVKKYPKHKIKITKIVPNPSGKDSGIEYIVIKNESKEKINLKNWSIATGTKEKTLVNHPVYDKLILKPGKTKKITKKYTAISLPNKTGVIEIRRPNGSIADTQKYGNKNFSIKDNSFYEKIDGIWTWTIPVDLEKQYQTQQIISQAIKNEKIFSQQILENKIAINAVYNSSNNISRDIVQTNSNLFVTLLQNINSLLHKTLLITQSFSETLRSNQVLAYSYTPTQIDLPDQPCEKPYLFTTPASQKFDLCK